MAKKVRRVKKKKKSAQDTTTAVENTAVQAAPVSKAMVKEKVASAKVKEVVTFHEEYAYVIKDLRRVLLVSGAMFLLLIALNLLLQ
jgi:hypothetical protein